MSDFTYQPSFESQVTHKPRVRVSKFGDGYQQRVAEGINADAVTWNVTFIRSRSVIDAIDSQLQGYGGVTAFTWTPQNHSEISVVCSSWSRSTVDGDAESLSATFEQVFE